MLNRCRTILGFLHIARRETAIGLSRTRLMKYAFLLARDFRTVPRATRYDFVPYRFGPFSFALYRDLANLQRAGYVSAIEDDARLEIPDHAEEDALCELQKLSSQVRRDILEIVGRYEHIRQEILLRDIYSRFPWYASRSERQDLSRSAPSMTPQAKPAVYTLGYEGRTVDGFFNLLLREGIRIILDVRLNPMSRKYGFARSSMASIAEKIGLEYVHIPELGVDAKRRAKLACVEDYVGLLNWYDKSLPGRTDAIHRALRRIRRAASVLVCVERDPAFCHRGRLAEAIAQQAKLAICHLGTD